MHVFCAGLFFDKLREVEDTKGLLSQISHHDQLAVTVNQNCSIVLPEPVVYKLLRPHKLAYYYFVFFDQGSEMVEVDRQKITVSNSQLVFGQPSQSFVHGSPNPANRQYKIGFDEQILALLPRAYPFLIDPRQSNVITFDRLAKQRVKALLSMLFQLLHETGKPTSTDIILAYFNTLLTEFNSAYFNDEPQLYQPDSKQAKYVEFKLTVEKQLTEQPDMHTIAEQLGMASSSLYALVKEQSGLSPKEWVTNQLILEAQRQLHYSPGSVKEIAYGLGFNDPAYFSRLFKKKTGKTVSEFLADLHDLSRR